ncbi:MAG: 50S ribosomal protein L18 [Alphaproteobacteria bacterium]
MNEATKARIRRKERQRHKMKKVIGDRLRLCVHRSNSHIYAQIVDDKKGHTLITVSTLGTEAKKKLKNGRNKAAASFVGGLIAQEALKKKIKTVVFDRSGFLYHGRVKALAESAREKGLVF